MKVVIVPPAPAEIKFDTYRFYLECITTFLALHYQDWEGFARQCASHTKYLHGMPGHDSAFVERHLRLAWNTESLLLATSSDIDLIRIANQWVPVQVYYAVYSAGEAVSYLLDGSKSASHAKILRKLTDHFVKKGLPPWNYAFQGCLGRQRGLHTSVNLPAGLHIPSNLQRQGVHPLQMIGRCLKAEHAHRVDDIWTKTIGCRKYAFDPGYTSLLHFLYRLRIKSNYEEVDLFIANAQDHQVRAFATDLKQFCSWTISYFEIFVARKIKKQALIDMASRYLQANAAATNLAARMASYASIL
jgi:hypothetical protein